jgi:hypothetical protein
VIDTKRVSFGVGQGFDASGKRLTNIEAKRDLAYSIVARAFGGFLASIGDGGWVDSQGNLVREESLSITSSVAPEALASVPVVASQLQALFAQESVLIAIESVDSVVFKETLPGAA